MLEAAFGDFKDSWNELASVNFLKGAQLECRQLPNDGEMPQMTLDSPLILSCLCKKDSAAYIYCAILKLAGIQNDFVRKAVAQAAQSNCTGALKFFQQHTEGTVAVPSKDLQKCFEADIIDYEWDDICLRQAHNCLAHGTGTTIQYNYHKLEHQLALCCLFSAVDISTDSVVEFAFSGSGFSDKLFLLHEVQNLSGFRQEPVSPAMVAGILALPAMDKKKTLALEALLAVMKTLCRTHHENDPDDPLKSYVEQKMDEYLSTAVVTLIQQAMGSIRLCQLVAMYEAIEDTLTPILMEHVNAKYKRALTDSASQEICAWMSKTDVNLQAPSQPELTGARNRSNEDLRQEFNNLKLRQLLARAGEYGLPEQAIEDAEESDNPRAALVTLLLEHSTGSEASARLRVWLDDKEIGGVLAPKLEAAGYFSITTLRVAMAALGPDELLVWHH